jgi:hypothetical protein
MAAPQFEQLMIWMFWRSSSICAGVSARMKFFSRRNSKNVMKRPCPASQRQ